MASSLISGDKILYEEGPFTSIVDERGSLNFISVLASGETITAASSTIKITNENYILIVDPDTGEITVSDITFDLVKTVTLKTTVPGHTPSKNITFSAPVGGATIVLAKKAGEFIYPKDSLNQSRVQVQIANIVPTETLELGPSPVKTILETLTLTYSIRLVLGSCFQANLSPSCVSGNGNI